MSEQVDGVFARVIDALFTKQAPRKPRATGLTPAKLGEAIGRPELEVREALGVLQARGLVIPAKAGARTWLANPEAATLLPVEPRKQARMRKARSADEPPPWAVEILERLARIEQAIGTAQTVKHGANGAPPVSAEELDRAIRETIRELGRDRAFGGVIPIPQLRRRVIEQTRAPRERFDERLIALERADVVDLKISNEPDRSDASEGIRVPGRGLVFFAIDR